MKKLFCQKNYDLKTIKINLVQLKKQCLKANILTYLKKCLLKLKFLTLLNKKSQKQLIFQEKKVHNS